VPIVKGLLSAHIDTGIRKTLRSQESAPVCSREDTHRWTPTPSSSISKQEFGAKEKARKPEHRRSAGGLGGLGEIAVDNVDHLCDFSMYFIAIGGYPS
jgi:hypothetical protein